MPYATQQDMIDRFGTPKLVQLTDIEHPMLGTIVPAVLAAKLADADAVIDGYLVGRYPLPLQVVPAILRFLACSIAMHLLLGDAATDVSRADMKAATDYLSAVAAGRINLMPPSEAPAPAGVGSVLFAPGSKVMGREADAAGWSD